MQFSLRTLSVKVVIAVALGSIALSHLLGQPDGHPLLTDLIIVAGVLIYFSVICWKWGPPPWYR